MIAVKQTLRQLRWYHWTAAALALLYVVYIALSYLYLPDKLKEMVQTDGSKMLGRKVTVQRIAFNPFTLALTADQFAIADRPRLPLVGWQRLYVNFDAWGSLFGWKARFSAVQLDEPRIAVEQRRDGFNFSDILARFARNGSAPPRRKSALALLVDSIRINSGHLRFDDVSGRRPARSTVDNVTVSLRNLYLATGDEELNPFNFQAVLPGGGRLSLSGRYRASPLRVQAQIQASNIHLAPFSDFLESRMPLKLGGGRLTLQTGLVVSMTDTLQVLLQGGVVTVNDLAVDDATPDPPLVRCRGIDVRGIEMDLARRRFHIGTVSVDGFDTHQWLDARGRSRLEPLLAQDETPPRPKDRTSGAAGKPWDVSVGKTMVRNSRLAFTDRRNGLDATQRVSGLNVTLSDLRLSPGAQMPVQLGATLNDRGTLSAEGQITLQPPAVDLHYGVKSLALAPFSPYLESLSWLRLRQGTLDVDGRVSMKAGQPAPLTLALNAGVNDLKALDTRSGSAVLQWKALKLNGVRLDTAKRQAIIGKILLNAPDIAAQVGADHRMNLATLMKPAHETAKPASAAKEPAPAAPAPWQVGVDTIAVQGGTMRYIDAGIKPVFKAGLYAVNFKLEHLTGAGKRPANFSFSSKVDRYAPFTAKGTLAPLQQQPGIAFTSRLRGYEMPALSPYTGTYIGYNLKSGKLSLNLKYRVRRRKMQGENGIVARQLYLGDKVTSDKAVHLPIGLGLALLRDAKGVIDLDVGVSGNLNDPSFSVSGLILKALKNIIVKAATSPFRLLASLVGGSEDLGTVEFPAGDGVLNADNQQKLRQLAKALAQRPQLAVSVTGCAGPAADEPVLRLKRVMEQLAARRKIPAAELQPETFLTVKANRKALRDINARLKLPGESKLRDTLAAAHPDLKGDALTERVYQEMLRDVASKQEITRQDLLALADRRALAMEQFLVEGAAVDHRRVRMLKAGGEDLKGRTCHLGVQEAK